MTKLDEFIIKWNGKFLEAYDASNLNQCYDLITAWANYIGLPAPMTLYAYQIYDACPQGWTRKQNNATAKPEAGAIVVWMKGYGGGIAGHTAVTTGKGVAEGKDSDWFEAFSENDPLGTPCQLKKYNYNYVRGWLRPNIDLEVSEPIMNNDLQKKASGFDRIWHAFNYNDITPEEAEEKDHLEFVAWIKNNIERAGKWDKLCIKAGINDSSSADFEQLYEVIFKKGEDLNSSLATKVLLLEEERDRALERQMEEAEKATKADELRAKWKSLYDTKKSEADIAKQGLATCSKNLTECQKEHELTWGDLILKVWNKIKGVRV